MAQSAITNPFASKSLVLTVGPGKKLFNIHEALLRDKTKFFDIHTEPNGETFEVPSKELELEPTFKAESSPSTDNNASEPAIDIATSEASIAPPDSTTANQNDAKVIKADYHLDTHYVTAFAIFVHWLYNDPPAQPKSPRECKTLIQAYLLALQYQALELQNHLLDCIRRYHIEHQVNFDLFFIYLLNRHGDDVNCKLIKYFVDQIVYEIADSSVEDFEASNLGLDKFLSERPTGNVRTALVYALAKIATAGKKGEKIVDPAVAREHDYHV